jgi:hypothetical protein
MKKLAIILAVGAAGLLNVKPANAQIRLGLNLHLGGVAAHVVVAPPVQYADYDEYSNDNDYYYLPDVEAYYDVAQQCYYYNDGQQWIHAAYLPGQYRNYDWRNGRHYEVRAQRPYLRHDEYRNRFGGFDQRGGGFDNRYANRGGFDNHRNDNRGWNGDNRGGQFNNQNRGNYSQPQNNGGQQGRGNYGQPQQNNGGQYQNGGQQNQGRGNSGQPANQNNGQQNQGRGNNGGQQGQDRGGNRGEEHFAANRMGGEMRPTRF